MVLQIKPFKFTLQLSSCPLLGLQCIHSSWSGGRFVLVTSLEFHKGIRPVVLAAGTSVLTHYICNCCTEGHGVWQSPHPSEVTYSTSQWAFHCRGSCIISFRSWCLRRVTCSFRYCYSFSCCYLSSSQSLYASSIDKGLGMTMFALYVAFLGIELLRTYVSVVCV